MPEPWILCGVQIPAGTSAQALLPVARLPTYTPIEVPIFVSRGRQPGPSVLLTGGLHGDEINGVEILRRMLARKLFRIKAGAVIVIPLVNVFGFLINARGVPDGKDINRSFPGSRNGSLAKMLAHDLMTQIVPFADLVVDLHTGGASRDNLPQIRTDLTFPGNRDLAMAFAPPAVIHFPTIAKSFRREVQQAGKRVVVYEVGESLRLDEPGIEGGISGILRMLLHLNMIRPSKELGSVAGKGRGAPDDDRGSTLGSTMPDSASGNLDSSLTSEGGGTAVYPASRWVRARMSGIFQTAVGLGETVLERAVLGTITDPFGREIRRVKAGVPGLVVGLNRNPVVSRGDALLHIATHRET